MIEKAKRGEKVDTKIAPRMLPIIVQNQNGEHFAPAYTSIEQMKTNAQYPAILNVTIDELLRIGSAPSVESERYYPESGYGQDDPASEIY